MGLKKICLIVLIWSLIFSLIACSPKSGTPDTETSNNSNPNSNHISTNSFGHTFANLNYKPWAASDEEYLYYDSLFGIYKIHKDGGEKIELCFHNADYLDVVGNWIYFVNSQGLFRMNKDGNDITKIIDNPVEYPRIVGDWFYYYAENQNTEHQFLEYNTYKIRTDGSEKTKISDFECAYMNIIDDWIYFVKAYKGKVYKIRTDGSYLVQLNNHDSRYIYVKDDWIYYINFEDKNRLYRMKLDGSEQTQLFEDKGISTFNIADDWVYITNAHENLLYKMRLDGTDKILIPMGRFVSIPRAIIIDDWIYYMLLQKIKIDGSQEECLNIYDDKTSIDDIDVDTDEESIIVNSQEYFNTDDNFFMR